MIGGAIVHPVLRIDGTLASAAPIPTILSAHGDRYRLATSSSTRITVRQSNVRLALTDIPARAPLQVHGIVLTDGRLAVDQIAVSLPQATLQGRVDSNHGGTFTVRTSSRTVMVHVGGSTPVYQGKNSLARSDLVVGDHVTVSGYAGRVSIIANKILVHRSRVDTSGSVLGLTADGFRMQTSNGVRTVIIGSVAGNPTVTVPTLSVGAPVRVVGFVRGDGVILAWQVNLT
jgi:hypothetical protein